MNRHAPAWFGLGLLLLALAVFGNGLWGRSLLAPLDVAPALLRQYRYLDPHSSGIPANHHISDQLLYDLPQQFTIYQSYRQGIIPWWDPYTYGGRPLLADAHVNGTDPLRVALYRLLPFPLAYNWTLIGHLLLSAWGAFLLLRRLSLPAPAQVGLALAYPLAGGHLLFFGHPWIVAAFLWYPFLWRVWEEAWEEPVPPWWSVPAASGLAAAVFLAGNLQSHVYLALFAVAFVFGRGADAVRRWRRVLGVVGLPLALGALCAAPVLATQIEAFLQSTRPIVQHPAFASLCGVGSLAGFYPWALGTFRTLDLGRIVNESGVAWLLFLGTPATLLALGALRHRPAPALVSMRRTALLLVVVYLVIASTPLKTVLYLRSAGLAVLGLLVLAALGLQRLQNSTASCRRAAFGVLGAVAGLALAVHLAVWIVYPQIVPRLLEYFEQQPHGDAAPETIRPLRRFQVLNLPGEVTFRNPETVAACAGALWLTWLLWSPRARRSAVGVPGLMLLNLVPLVLFAHRFVPRHPVSVWEQLLAGGPEQQRVARALVDSPARLYETTEKDWDKLYPKNFPHLYRVRTVHGYSAIQPPNIYRWPAADPGAWVHRIADATYDIGAPGRPGQLAWIDRARWARFQWTDDGVRPLAIRQPDLCTITIGVGDGLAGHLQWTDNRYPGWQATTSDRRVDLRPVPPLFAELDVPAGARTLWLRYRPTYLVGGLVATTVGLLGIVLAGFLSWRRV
ncbi:hypothetical protein HQ590_01675 [bacterium]|nr:hypothetical protein [bacterium]